MQIHRSFSFSQSISLIFFHKTERYSPLSSNTNASLLISWQWEILDTCHQWSSSFKFDWVVLSEHMQLNEEIKIKVMEKSREKNFKMTSFFYWNCQRGRRFHRIPSPCLFILIFDTTLIFYAIVISNKYLTIIISILINTNKLYYNSYKL